MVILCFFLLNLLIKKKFFCISCLSLLYVLLAFGGSIYIYSFPRSGESFVDLEAMLFLAVCMAFLCVPALFFKDTETDHCLLTPSYCKLKNIGFLFIIIGFPVSLFYFLRAFPYLFQYLSNFQDINRDDFRETLSFDTVEENPFILLVQLLGSIDFAVLFLLIVSILFLKEKKNKFYLFLLAFSGAGYCFDSLKYAARAFLYQRITFIACCTMILYGFSGVVEKQILRKAMCWLGSLLIIPLSVITFARFNKNLFYALVSYFSTGPYSFSCDYVARTQYTLPSLKGLMTHGFFSSLIDKFFGFNFYEQGITALKDLSDSNSETYWVYRDMSGGYSGEFKTIVGSFLIDHSVTYALVLCMLMCYFFSHIFSIEKKMYGFSTCLVGTIYFHILVNAPMGAVFVSRAGNLELICLFLFAAVLRYYELRQERCPNALLIS